MDDGERIRELMDEAHQEFVASMRRLRAQRLVWRADGLVHVIRPIVSEHNGKAHVDHWESLCRSKVLSRGLKEREPGAIPTCLACIATNQ